MASPTAYQRERAKAQIQARMPGPNEPRSKPLPASPMNTGLLGAGLTIMGAMRGGEASKWYSKISRK